MFEPVPVQLLEENPPNAIMATKRITPNFTWSLRKLWETTQTTLGKHSNLLVFLRLPEDPDTGVDVTQGGSNVATTPFFWK